MVTLTDAPEQMRAHPATRAWRRLRPDAGLPARIVALRERDKADVYRLDAALAADASVVAKHCRTPGGVVERTIYEEILPSLPVSALGYFGHVDDEDGSCWLFLEQAGGVRFAPDLPAHRTLAARWLGLLHAGAASVAAEAPLPDRGPAHYLAQLRAARLTIGLALADAAPSAGERDLLDDVVALCDAVEARWGGVEDSCAQMPRTLVHGDFRPKNVHVRARGAGATLLAMDWETAGWGVAAADVASVRDEAGDRAALGVYAAVVRQRWPSLGAELVDRMVEVGKLFRRLAAIAWSSESLPHRWEKSLAVLRVHRDALGAIVEEARWS